MRQVNVWFKHANNDLWLDWLVAKMSGGERIHAEIELLVADTRVTYTTYMNPPYNHVLQRYSLHRLPTRLWSKYTFSVNTTQLNKIEHTCNTFLQRRYDYVGALCSVLGPVGRACARFVNGPDKLFCSELVARALVAGGVLDMSNVECQTVTPEQLAVAVGCSVSQPISACSLSM